PERPRTSPLSPAYRLTALRGLDRSADFQSAVSPNCIRQSLVSVPRGGVPQRLAECNSAIQQSTTLRYDGPGNRCSPEGVQRTCEGQEPWQDPRVWEMIASGGARAVHHIESPAMTCLC